MATITDSKGNVIIKEPDTLEDWRQAAEVEAGIRREFQTENERLRKLLKEARQYVDDAGFDEDPETTRNAGILLREIDALLTAPE